MGKQSGNPLYLKKKCPLKGRERGKKISLLAKICGSKRGGQSLQVNTSTPNTFITPEGKVLLFFVFCGYLGQQFLVQWTSKKLWTSPYTFRWFSFFRFLFFFVFALVFFFICPRSFVRKVRFFFILIFFPDPRNKKKKINSLKKQKQKIKT